MTAQAQPKVVLHPARFLSAATAWPGFMVPALLLLAGAARAVSELPTRGPGTAAADLAVTVGVLLGLLGVVILKRRVSGLWLDPQEVAVISWTGRRRSLRATDVASVAALSAPLARGYPSRPVVLFIGAGDRPLVRLRVDGYDLPGLECSIRDAGLNLVGSFSDSLTFDEAVARYPRMYGAGVRHPLRTLALLAVVGSVGTILLITLIVAVAAGHL